MEMKLVVEVDLMKRFDIVSILKKLKIEFEVIESEYEHELKVNIPSIEVLFELSDSLIEQSRDTDTYEYLIGLEIHTSRSGDKVAKLYTTYE